MKRLQSQLLPRKSYRTFDGDGWRSTTPPAEPHDHERQPALPVQARPAEPEFPLADLLLELKGGAS